MKTKKIFTSLLCQCPQSGDPHFYIYYKQDYWEKFVCVNALSRALLISTLPFWNQLFKPLCGLISAGIFQNILIITQKQGQKWAEHRLYFFKYNFEAFYIAIIDAVRNGINTNDVSCE